MSHSRSSVGNGISHARRYLRTRTHARTHARTVTVTRKHEAIVFSEPDLEAQRKGQIKRFLNFNASLSPIVTNHNEVDRFVDCW